MEHFPVREKSGNFEYTEKVRKFYTKYWRNWNWIVDNFCFIFSLIFNLTVFKNRTLKKYRENGKNTEEVGEFCQSDNVGTMVLVIFIEIAFDRNIELNMPFERQLLIV